MTFEPAMGVVSYHCGIPPHQLLQCPGRNFVFVSLNLWPLSGVINTTGLLQGNAFNTSWNSQITVVDTPP